MILEMLLGSSALILAVVLLRALFGRRMGARLRYAFWLPVLLRLLLPLSVGHFAASPANLARISSGEDPVVYSVPLDTDAPVDAGVTVQPNGQILDSYSFGHATRNGDGTITRYGWKTVLSDALPAVWIGGMAVVAVWFLFCNLLFYRGLCRNRSFLQRRGKVPVYVAETPSPCLCGQFRPAIYVTPAVAADETALPHVLLHEETHLRHLDPLWSLLRTVCLIVWWFDPLVWLAAVLSRHDSELCCDEAVIRHLGEERRVAYGRTLLALAGGRRRSTAAFCAASTLSSAGKPLRERICAIADRTGPRLWAVFAAALLALLAAACAFTGATKEPEGPSNTLACVALTEEERENILTGTLDYDIFRWHHDVDGAKKGLTVWVECWEDGACTAMQRLRDTDLRGAPGDLDIGLYEDSRILDLAVNAGDGDTTFSSLDLSRRVDMHARAMSWLGSGGDPRFGVTADEPVILLALAYQPDPSGVLNSYDCEYLMEYPEVLAQYDRIVLIKCAFTSGDAADYRIPGTDLGKIQTSYQVTLIEDGTEMGVRGFDSELPADIVMDCLVKSAAWPSDELGERPYMFRIRQTLTSEEGSETHDYYAFRLENGRAALRMGLDGMYTLLSEELMAQLELAAGVGPGQIYDLEAAVSNAILQNASGGGGTFSTESHVTLEVEEDGDLVTVYCLALVLDFDCEDGKLAKATGSHIPTALTFRKGADGAYTLREYWIPEDGTGYASSIREKFPDIAEQDALESQLYVQEQTQVCYAKALAHFGIDPAPEIAAGVELLASYDEPPSRTEGSGLGYWGTYQDLCNYGDATLRYIFGEYQKGVPKGRRDDVLWPLLWELLGGENIAIDVTNGQAYFDAWKSHVLDLYEKNPLSYFKEHAPKCYLLLDVLGYTKPQVEEEADG